MTTNTIPFIFRILHRLFVHICNNHVHIFSHLIILAAIWRTQILLYVKLLMYKNDFIKKHITIMKHKQGKHNVPSIKSVLVL